LPLATLLLSVCSFAAVADQQQAAGAGGDTPRVRLDAVVTDAQGRPILDLHPSDFELLENGEVTPLDAVELHPLPDAAVNLTPIETEGDEKRAAREPGTRAFAFVLDEFHVSPGPSTDRVRRSLTEFVDEKLRPQDLAVIIKPLDAVTSIRLTRDRALLHGAIDGFAGRKGDYAPRTRFEELYIGHAPAAVSAARRQIVTAALRELTMHLGDLDADRAALVFVSEGFPRDVPAPRGRPIELQGVVRASSRFHLSTYTFNPAAAAEDAATPVERERADAMLQWLAEQTGGRAFGSETAVAGLARLSHDLDAYYALSYVPAHADGRFHPVEVRVKRRGVLVHTAPGYWSPPGAEWRATMASMATMLPMSRRPLRRSSAIDAWIGLLRDTDGRTRMIVTWEPRLRGMSAPQVVALRARTTTGETLFDGRLGRVGSGSTVPSDSARFQVPTGRVEIDMTIYDGEGKSLDTDARDFDVPDLRLQKRGPVLLAPEVVRARTLRDFQSAAADPDAAPSSVRTFARSDRLLIRVSAFDSSGTAVLVTAKVLNGWGQPMRDIDALDATPRDRLPQFALPLSWLVPGEYQIELMATNANGAVRERVTFKVTG
jgi:VWFA-related protein